MLHWKLSEGHFRSFTVIFLFSVIFLYVLTTCIFHCQYIWIVYCLSSCHGREVQCHPCLSSFDVRDRNCKLESWTSLSISFLTDSFCSSLSLSVPRSLFLSCTFTFSGFHSSSFLHEITPFSPFFSAQFSASHSQDHLLSLSLAFTVYSILPSPFPGSFDTLLSHLLFHSCLNPFSSPTPYSLSPLTLLSVSLYPSNLLLSSHVPVTIPEAALSELCQRLESVPIVTVEDLINHIEKQSWGQHFYPLICSPRCVGGINYDMNSIY